MDRALAGLPDGCGLEAGGPSTVTRGDTRSSQRGIHRLRWPSNSIAPGMTSWRRALTRSVVASSCGAVVGTTVMR